MNHATHVRRRSLLPGGVLALAVGRVGAQHQLMQAGASVSVAANAGDEAAITIDNFTFAPQSISVVPGTRVIWTNRDDIPHTIIGTEDPQTLVSPPLDTDDQFAFTFAMRGT
jgi:plastocyanin